MNTQTMKHMFRTSPSLMHIPHPSFACARARHRAYHDTGNRLPPSAATARRQYGPAPPPKIPDNEKPEWVRILEQDRDVDEDVADILDGTDGDPEKITDRINTRLKEKRIFQGKQGVDAMPKVEFREVDYFNCWIWLELYHPPATKDLELLDTVLKSWFVLGKLGGFNASNMQVLYKGEDDKSFLSYSVTEAEKGFDSFLHEIGDLQSNENWARVKINFGTSDELCLDVLLNTLFGFSKEHVGIRSICVGGVNEDWPVGDDDGMENGVGGADGGDFDVGVDENVDIDPLRAPSLMQDDDYMESLEQMLDEEKEGGEGQEEGRGEGSRNELDAQFEGSWLLDREKK